MTLCGFEIAPGEKRQVKLPVPGGAPLEAWLLCGAHPGKTLVVTAGVHGCEYVGILALQKLVETLDCATLYGQVILLPLVNPKGFFAGGKTTESGRWQEPEPGISRQGGRNGNPADGMDDRKTPLPGGGFSSGPSRRRLE